MAQLQSVLLEMQVFLAKMVTYKCGLETGTCQDLKIGLEIELHQSRESIEQAERRLKQVDLESKLKLDQLQELKCKVNTGLTLLR